MKDSKNTQVLDLSPGNLARHLQEQKNDLLDVPAIRKPREMGFRLAARQEALAVSYPCLELVRVPFSEVKSIAEGVPLGHQFLKS